jgi:hypothetical protein
MQTSIRAIDQRGWDYDFASFEENVCIPSVGDEVIYAHGTGAVESRTFEYSEPGVVPARLCVVLKIRLKEEPARNIKVGFAG